MKKNTEESTLIKNINSKRKDLNLKVSQLSKISGVSDKTLRKILDGSTKNPTITNVSRCAEALGCTTSDLIGETKMLTYQEDLLLERFNNLDEVSQEAVFDFMNTLGEVVRSTESNFTLMREVPLFQQKVSAGIGNFLDSSSYDYIPVSVEYLPEEKVFALQVSGDSMEPLISDQDYILIQPTKNIEENDIGVFILNGESYVKQFTPGELISLNDNYKPIKFNEFDDLQVVGKYLKKIKPEIA